MNNVKTPVAFLIFNRPDTTERVFAAIRNARPKRLLVVADGPRSTHPDDGRKCRAARSIIEGVDWDCEVLKNYSDVNLGCKRRVSSGLDWVFSAVDRAIILEDDILPDPTFFPYCDELLERYAEDERVGAICGCNFQDGIKRSTASYYFSRYGHIWGWASWARAWKYYDVNMNLWPIIRDGNQLQNIIENKRTLAYCSERFEATYKGEIDTWDYQWTFACWIQNMSAILPEVNLIQNIGFGEDATHTTNSTDNEVMLRPKSLTFPLKHPELLIRNTIADAYTEDKLGWKKMRLWRRLLFSCATFFSLLIRGEFKMIHSKLRRRLHGRLKPNQPLPIE